MPEMFTAHMSACTFGASEEIVTSEDIIFVLRMAFCFLLSAFCCDCGLGSFNSFDVMF